MPWVRVLLGLDACSSLMFFSVPCHAQPAICCGVACLLSLFVFGNGVNPACQTAFFSLLLNVSVRNL